MTKIGNPISYTEICDAASLHYLEVFGAFHPEAKEAVPVGCKTLLLLGPKEPGFWLHAIRQPEFMDNRPDPLDRWSERVINSLSKGLGGTAIFPFGGPPYAPFISWGMRSGRAWQSPVTLLVDDTAGLFLSYRGAIALTNRVELPANPSKPCDSCPEMPCKGSCPVFAIDSNGYDLKACHSYLNTDNGQDCMNKGCAVRRACPVSQSYGRRAVQSAHHMKSFHP